MSKYIDVDAYEQKMKDYYPKFWKTVLTEQPSIELVTCKNCRYRKMKKTTFRGEPYIYYRCELLEREVEDDEFCSWGDE